MSIAQKIPAAVKAPLHGEYPISPPQLPLQTLNRFPELKKFNEDFKRFWFEVKSLLVNRQQQDISEPLNNLINVVDALKKQIADLQEQVESLSEYQPKIQNVRTLNWHRIYLIDRNNAGDPIPVRIFVDQNPIS